MAQGSSDADIHNQVEPEIIANLSPFVETWNLDEFGEIHKEIINKLPTLSTAGISKLQAQFILQA